MTPSGWSARLALALLVVAGTCAATPGDAPVITGFSVKGTRTDPLETVQAMLASELAPGTPWDTDRKERLAKLCDRLEYECAVTERRGAGGVSLVVELAPLTLVRYVSIRGNDLRLLESPIFDEEIKRRLTLRPGSRLPYAEEARKSKIAREEKGLREYLAHEGYFEGVVHLDVVPLAKREAKLVIHVNKGPAYLVGRVKVIGNTAVSTETIVDMVNQRRSLWRLDFLLDLLSLERRRFSKERLDEDLRRVEELYHRRGFPRARVTTDFDVATSFDPASHRVRFTVRIKEHKRLDVAFRGNDHVDSDDLNDSLTFSENRSYDDHEADASALAIRREYQARGYFQAVVTWTRERIHQSVDRITFRIHEGNRLPVKEVGFRGNVAIATEQLRAVVRTRPLPGRFARILGEGGYLTTLQLEQDEERLRELYRKRGYSTAQVDAVVATDRRLLDDIGGIAAAATAGSESRGLYVEFRIDEGPRDTVRRVSFLDNRTLNDLFLERATLLRSGASLQEESLDADTNRLVQLYAAFGFPYARVDSYVSPVPGAEGSYDIVHLIEEGPQVHVGKVVVRGNFLTREWVIRQNLELRTGEKFTATGLERGQRQLRNTRLFSNVRLDLVGADEKKDPVHLIVSVNEGHDNRGVFELASGFSTDNLFFAGGSYDLRNIGGVGASFQMKGEVGFERVMGEADFTLPLWWMRRYAKLPVESELSAAYLSQDHKRFGELTSIELGVRLSRQLSDHLRVSLAYTWRTFGRNEELVRPAGAHQDLEDTSVDTRSALLGPAIVYDQRRDAAGNFNPVSPDRGYRLTASVQAASRYLGGDSEFLKIQTSGKHHKPLGGRFTLTNGFRYDHGIPLGDSVLLPEVERFFAGGDTTVRGIARDRLATEVIRTPIYPGADVYHVKVLPAGGNIRALYNVDLQLTVWDSTLPLASAVFVDTGLVTNSFDSFDVGDFRYSVGVAFLRVILPAAGSASFEWAVPIDPGVGDDPRGRIHFNLGFVF